SWSPGSGKSSSGKQSAGIQDKNDGYENHLSPGKRGKAKVVWTYSFRFLIREDAGLSTSREITVNFERVPGTSLVGINPVFTWMREEKGRKAQDRGHFSNLLTWDVSSLMAPPFPPCFLPQRLRRFQSIARIGKESLSRGCLLPKFQHP
uniref:Uncharacterized protein n=1 Tax=Corvus moneduloides TaxID=1196302 RepID=A0A8C3DLJ3_CORMO